MQYIQTNTIYGGRYANHKTANLFTKNVSATKQSFNAVQQQNETEREPDNERKEFKSIRLKINKYKETYRYIPDISKIVSKAKPVAAFFFHTKKN